MTKGRMAFSNRLLSGRMIPSVVYWINRYHLVEGIIDRLGLSQIVQSLKHRDIFYRRLTYVTEPEASTWIYRSRGSPPIRIRDPSIILPPGTRSISASPVLIQSVSEMETNPMGTGSGENVFLLDLNCLISDVLQSRYPRRRIPDIAPSV